MRSIYRDNDLQDDWVLWGYNPASMAEASLSLLHLLLEARRGGNCTLRTPLRLVMEHHYSRTADWDAVPPGEESLPLVPAAQHPPARAGVG